MGKEIENVAAAFIVGLMFCLAAFCGYMLAEWKHMGDKPFTIETQLYKNESCEEQSNGTCTKWRIECWAGVQDYGETAKHVSWVSCNG